MIDEMAGHLWWRRIGRDSTDVHVYLQTGRAVYRCSQSEDAWREVDTSPDPSTFVFSSPLEKIIAKCLTDSDGCKYVCFSDHTAIRIFDPANAPSVFTLCSEGVAFLNQDDCERLFSANDGISATPIIRA